MLAVCKWWLVTKTPRKKLQKVIESSSEKLRFDLDLNIRALKETVGQDWEEHPGANICAGASSNQDHNPTNCNWWLFANSFNLIQFNLQTKTTIQPTAAGDTHYFSIKKGIICK